MQAFQQVTEDYLSFMQDLQARNGGFRATLCGRGTRDTQDDEENQDSNNSGGSSAGQLPATSAGVLAGLCGYRQWPNGTFYKSDGVHPFDYYWNMSQNIGNDNVADEEKEDQELSCSRLAEEYSMYNATGRKGS